MRTLPISVLRIQRIWRGKRGRMQARERVAGLHWLRKCLCYLVRIRRKNREHRAWRAGVLASYRQPPPPKCAASNNALLANYSQQELQLDERRNQVESLR